MERMDESKASDYYRRRLLVAVFGQWVSAVCAAAEMDLQATAVYQLHAKAQGLTRLEQYLHRRIHIDDRERLGATMYCLLLLHRGIQRWGRHLSNVCKVAQKARKANRRLRIKRLQRGWERLRRRVQQRHHFVQMRSALLAPPQALSDSVHSLDDLLKSARSRLLTNHNISNAMGEHLVPQSTTTVKTRYRQLCHQFFQKLSFVRLFQSQGRQYQALSDKLLRKRQTRRALKKLIDFQDRQEQFHMLFRLCSEHYLHGTFRRLHIRSSQQTARRLTQIANTQSAQIHQHRKQCQRTLFYFKEYSIQRSFEHNRLIRCAEHIAMPNTKRRALRRWLAFAQRRRLAKQSSISIPTLTHPSSKEKKMMMIQLTLVPDKVVLYVVKVWRFRRLREYLSTWTSQLRDFRKRHRATMRYAVSFHRGHRLEQSWSQWSAVWMAMASTSKRLQRRARYHHAYYTIRQSFLQFADRLQETRKQLIQSKYVAVSFYKLWRFQRALKRWRRFATDKQAARHAMYEAKRDHHSYKHRQCAKMLLVAAIEKDGEGFANRLTMRHFYRSWKHFITEQRKFKIDGTMQKIQQYQELQKAEVISRSATSLPHPNNSASSSGATNLTAMLARTPPRYSSALNSASPLLLSPTSVTDFHARTNNPTPSNTGSSKYYAARAPPRGLVLLPSSRPLAAPTAAWSSTESAHNTSHVSELQSPSVSKREKLLLLREVLQLIQEQRSVLLSEDSEV